MQRSYVGRLAPSPTGDLHMGHVRTFAVAWLRARKADGTLILRIEDLDPPREVPGSAERILEDLHWLGFDWDGPIVRQSERNETYLRALHSLEAAGRTFSCSCSRKEIAAVASAPHDAEELGPRYPGTCRSGAIGDPPFAVRFASADESVQFDDGFVGPVDGSEWLDDFVLRRKDRLWAYQFAVVVDDAEARVSEVVRGDDLLSSTPRQIAIYRALGLQPPQFVHIPLVMGNDGKRLSKRHDSPTIRAIREHGQRPADVFRRLAPTLGIERDYDSLRSMLKAFSLEQIPRNSVQV